MPKFNNDMPTMENVFKQHPRPEIRQGLLREYRLKATDVLQNSMAEMIIRLQTLVADVENPSSPFWKGQVESGPYLAQNIKLLSGKKFKCDKKLRTQVSADHEDEEAEEVAGEEAEDGEDVDDVDDDDDDDDGEDAKVPARFGSDKPMPKDDAFASTRPGTSWDHVVPTNPIQAECIKVVRTEAERLSDQLSTLRIWLSLETPLIEDGNSFGADVQSHLIDQVDKYLTRMGTYMNNVNRHYHDRMVIVRRWVQMPNMSDFAQDLASSDRMDHHLARGYIRNMLLVCGSLLGNFGKNWAKVINPKRNGRGAEGMY